MSDLGEILGMLLFIAVAWYGFNLVFDTENTIRETKRIIHIVQE